MAQIFPLLNLFVELINIIYVFCFSNFLTKNTLLIYTYILNDNNMGIDVSKVSSMVTQTLPQAIKKSPNVDTKAVTNVINNSLEKSLNGLSTLGISSVKNLIFLI